MASWAVDAGRFYSPYHGHETEELEVILHGLRDAHGTETPCIFLAGDSSVDNKHWCVISCSG